MTSRTRWVGLVHRAPGAPESWLDAVQSHLAGSDDVVRWHLGLNDPRSFNGGDATLDAVMERPLSALGPALGTVDLVQPEVLVASAPEPDLAPCVKRTLFARVEPGTPVAVVAQFEREVAAMPRYISTIRNWALSRVVAPAGSRWTHVWEQEYESVDGLLGEYMLHPYHWGWVDRWFDPEMQWHIVVQIAHVFCPADSSVLAWAVDRVAKSSVP